MKFAYIIGLAFGTLWPCFAVAQQEVTLYYDQEKQIPKEKFLVSEDNPQVLHGSYTAYYLNGQVNTRGSYHNNAATGWWEYFYENGKPKMRGTLQDNVYHGLWEYFYENGNLEMKGAIFDSIRQGYWQFFYEKGSPKSEGSYLDNKKDGLWKYYYEDGSLKAEEYFEGDTSTYREFYASGSLKLEGQQVNGVSDGVWKQYYESGHTKAEGNYKRGVRQGKWRFYHENGKLSSTGDFLDGSTVGKWTYFHENGKISAEGAEKNGLKEGYWKLYHSNGDFKGEAVFNQGEGVYQEFYEDGTLKVKGNMQNGIHQGKWEYYYEDGTLEGEAVFRNGKGNYHGYYRDGALKMQGTIENGERKGIWQLFKPDGQLAGYYTSVYENNEPVFKALDKSAEAALNPESNETATLNPEYLYRKKTTRYFKPRVNEFKSTIVGINPVGLVFYRLPLSIEYYMQERLGYELEVGIERNPFFLLGKDMEANTTYRRGFFLAVKQKFYHTDTRSGMFYFGHRLGFDYISHHANIAGIDSTRTLLSLPIHQVIAREQRFSYGVIVGTRLMKDSDVINTRITKDIRSPGLTFDLFTGIGIGYRIFNKIYTQGQYDQMIKKTPQSKMYIPLQFGATVGYVF